MSARSPDPKPVLKDEALYLLDNGRCLCGQHAGSARWTGMALDGRRALELTPAVLARFEQGVLPMFRCEVPTCPRRVSP